MNKQERKARLVDAIGGGICSIHGEYIGTGKYHLKSCPLCDIEEHNLMAKQKVKVIKLPDRGSYDKRRV